MAVTRDYRVTVVALDNEGYPDLDVYGEELEVTCSSNDMATIVAQVAVLGIGLKLDDFLNHYVLTRTRTKMGLT